MKRSAEETAAGRTGSPGGGRRGKSRRERERDDVVLETEDVEDACVTAEGR